MALCYGHSLRWLGFHPELACGCEDEDQRGAEGEDLADSDVLGQDSAEDETGDLRGEDDPYSSSDSD